jgi:peptide methionine sulfoxide reductase MsrA
MKNTSGLQAASSKREQTAVFSDGCFLGLDAVFKYVKVVSKVGSGYVGEDSKGAVRRTEDARWQRNSRNPK